MQAWSALAAPDADCGCQIAYKITSFSSYHQILFPEISKRNPTGDWLRSLPVGILSGVWAVGRLDVEVVVEGVAEVAGLVLLTLVEALVAVVAVVAVVIALSTVVVALTALSALATFSALVVAFAAFSALGTRAALTFYVSFGLGDEDAV